MKNLSLLAGLHLFIFYSCIPRINGANRCFECKNLQICDTHLVNHTLIEYDASDYGAVEYHNGSKIYHPNLPCVPPDAKVLRDLNSAICFVDEKCTLFVGSSVKGQKLKQYCNNCAKSCKCVNGNNYNFKTRHQCVNCKELKNCVGPDRIWARDNEVIDNKNNITYHPDLECVPDGFDIKGSISNYVCFHKPFCKLVMSASITSSKTKAKYCKNCAEQCKCGVNMSRSISPIVIFFGIYANFNLL